MHKNRIESGKIVIKICKTKTPEEVLVEFDNLSRFNREFNDKYIGVPKPIGVDPSERAIVMEHINGISLKSHLLTLRKKEKETVYNSIRLAAIALSKFHKISTEASGAEYYIHSPYIEKGLDLDMITQMNVSCNLRLKIVSFIDFAAWNIIVENRAGQRIYLIDFPDNNSSLPPHVDLARFKYSLDVISRYPRYRLLGKRLWDMDNLYEMFLTTYCSEMGIRINRQDRSLINWFEAQYAKKLMGVYDSKSGIRTRLEGIYMKRYISLLSKDNQRGTHK
jgi:hypothetical protein